ncbi:MAG: 5'-3' exonuclease H3TH domain-containing protein, partial [Cyanobacteriota bacterium]|nr:5'-3' exonuclease H3TH domain-containing protein [Cyanobacteriota bacterium]
MTTDGAADQPATAIPPAARPLLLLVDGHSLAFRSFYAFAKGGDGGLSTRDGLPTSVTYGFLKALLDNCRGLSPDGVVIAFDTAEPTFRHEADANYKAHREEAPEAFFTDLQHLQAILRGALNLPLCMAPGFEADDVLGTLAYQAADQGWRVLILSGDRDLFQLVDDERGIAVLYMGGGPQARSGGPTEIRREGVISKLGVPPEDVVDLKALTGDSSDNIPGVKGVGPKTAITLLQAHGDLDGIYAALDRQKGALRTKLATDRDKAYLSRRLARIDTAIPLPEPPRLGLGQVDGVALAARLEELELFSLRRQVESFCQLFSRPGEARSTMADERPAPGLPSAGDQAPGSAAPPLAPGLVDTPAALEALISRLLAATDPAVPVAFDTETTDLNPFRAELVGVGLAWGEGPAELAYIPIGHQQGQQLPLDGVLTALAPWLASAGHPKTLQNAKYDRLILLRHGLALEGVVMDTLLADYLRDPAERHNL